MKKKSQTIRWHVTFTDNITDEIKPMIKYVHKYANEKIFLVYSEGQRVLQWDSKKTNRILT